MLVKGAPGLYIAALDELDFVISIESKGFV